MKKFYIIVLSIFYAFLAQGQAWEHIYPTMSSYYGAISPIWMCYEATKGAAFISEYPSHIIRLNTFGDSIASFDPNYHYMDSVTKVGILQLLPNGNVLMLSKWVDTNNNLGCNKILEYDTTGVLVYNETIRSRHTYSTGLFLVPKSCDYYIEYILDTNRYSYDSSCSCYMGLDSLDVSWHIAKYDSSHNMLWEFGKSWAHHSSVAVGMTSEPFPIAPELNYKFACFDGGIAFSQRLDTTYLTSPDVNAAQNSGIFKLNSDGNLAWQFLPRSALGFGPDYDCSAGILLPTRDSGYLIAVAIFDTLTPNVFNRKYLIRLDKDGNMSDSVSGPFVGVWEEGYLPEPVVEASDGRFICKHETYHPDVALFTTDILRLDSHLNFSDFVPSPFYGLQYRGFTYVPNEIGGCLLMSQANISATAHSFHICNFDSLLQTYPGSCSGSLMRDYDHNCIETGGDIPIKISLVQFVNSVDSSTFYTFSDDSGLYRTHIPLGDYYVSHALKPMNLNECPDLITLAGITSPYPVIYDYSFYDTLIPNLHDLEVSSIPTSGFIPGFDATEKVFIYNAGTETYTGVVKALIDPSILFSSSTPLPDSINGDTVYYTISNLHYDETQSLNITFQIPASLPFGAPLEMFYSIDTAADLTPTNNIDTTHVIVGGPFDPNLKSVNRPLYTSADHDFVYRVQFQNTGTYYAKNVLVVDTIDSALDMSTFKVLSGSPFMPVVSWHEGNRLFFNFPDIYLPDSNTNEPGSHGEFVYSIRPKWSTAVGDTITNTAYIYFDYNVPVITNTTMNIISNNPMSSGTVLNNAADVRLYPNPTTGQVNLLLPAGNQDKWTLVVTDLTGHEILRNVYSANASFDLNGADGLYLVQLRNMRTGAQTVKKVLVQR